MVTSSVAVPAILHKASRAHRAKLLQLLGSRDRRDIRLVTLRGSEHPELPRGSHIDRTARDLRVFDARDVGGRLRAGRAEADHATLGRNAVVANVNVVASSRLVIARLQANRHIVAAARAVK